MKFYKQIPVILSCLFLVVGCSSQTNHEKMVDILGHRGCRGLLPENSMIAFEKAIELGVHTLELDVVISKDHQVVVSHEPFMNHAIALDLQGNPIPEHDTKNYNLYQMNYDSIRLYDCGSKQHPDFLAQEKVKVAKPLLTEVIEMAEKRSQTKIKYNIEIKRKPSYDEIYAPKVDEFVRLVLKVVQNYNLGDRVNLQAFDLETLEEIKKQAPEMKLALLVDADEHMEKKLQQLSFVPEIMSPYYKLLTKEKVEKYQTHFGMKVIPWTINDVEVMKTYIKWNVDGIITDYPDTLIKLYQN